MEKHTVMVANNILNKIDKIEEILQCLGEMENQNLAIRTKDCPLCIDIPTKPLRNNVLGIIKNYYEQELAEYETRLKEI